MPSLFSVQLGLNRGNIFATGFALVLVVALFFIPEILNFHAKVSDVNPQHSAEEGVNSVNMQEVLQPEEPAYREEDAPALSPLEEVLYLIEDGYYDSKRARLAPAVLEQDGQPLQEESPQTFEVAEGEAISWEDIRSGNNRTALREARREMLKLETQIDQRYRNTRFALVSYADGIENILDDADGIASPEEAIRYLVHQDQMVDKAMEADRVDRFTYMSWREISLGELFSSTSAGRFKTPVPFDPQFRLTRARIIRQAKYNGDFNPQSTPYVYLNARVQGEDVELIRVYRNGEKKREVKLAQNVEESTPFRHVDLGRFEAYGVFKIVIKDKFGEEQTRLYTFFPKAASFGWQRSTQEYAVPYSRGVKSPSVDRIFLRTGPRRGGGNLLLAGSLNTYDTF